MRDLYSQYLWRFDPRLFAFIGITERYVEDLARFVETFGWQVALVEHALRNPDREDDAYPISAKLRERLIQHHARDMALYRSALQHNGTTFPRKAQDHVDAEWARMAEHGP